MESLSIPPAQGRIWLWKPEVSEGWGDTVDDILPFLVLLSISPATANGWELMGIDLGCWLLPHGPFSWMHVHFMGEALITFPLTQQSFLGLAISPTLSASRFLDSHTHSDSSVPSHQRWDLGSEVFYKPRLILSCNHTCDLWIYTQETFLSPASTL